MTDRLAATEKLADAIRTGDLASLRDVLGEYPELASTPLGGRFKTRTALHLVTDWPGYFPNGPQVVRLLAQAGADPDGRAPGDETPLHWAASSDDADVAEALIDAGADVDAPDGSIGTPLANAVGYGCWHVADLLVARGAKVDQPWQAAALGLLDRLAELLDAEPNPEEISKAFWHACSGAQRRAAEYALSRGAELIGCRTTRTEHLSTRPSAQEPAGRTSSRGCANSALTPAEKNLPRRRIGAPRRPLRSRARPAEFVSRRLLEFEQ